LGNPCHHLQATTEPAREERLGFSVTEGPNHPKTWYNASRYTSSGIAGGPAGIVPTLPRTAHVSLVIGF
jgi:hypothetical protein